jgi:hypothetical protein
VVIIRGSFACKNCQIGLSGCFGIPTNYGQCFRFVETCANVKVSIECSALRTDSANL